MIKLDDFHTLEMVHSRQENVRVAYAFLKDSVNNMLLEFLKRHSLDGAVVNSDGENGRIVVIKMNIPDAPCGLAFVPNHSTDVLIRTSNEFNKESGVDYLIALSETLNEYFPAFCESVHTCLKALNANLETSEDFEKFKEEFMD